MPATPADWSPVLRAYVAEREREFDRITPERRDQLAELAAYVAETRAKGQRTGLTFVCTHNSRRSHMSQLWAAVAAERYGQAHIRTYSGGTEATAFNPRAVAALERAGLDIDRTTDDTNPIYHVRTHVHANPMTCFSKIYDQAPNPTAAFAAIMVCNSADEACPMVPGADRRFGITYVDPKAHDNTPKEAAAYDERCAQIARELLFTMRLAAER
ncbi:MAG: protein-tyrosine-phosphatase [Planctomycetota bacterium]